MLYDASLMNPDQDAQDGTCMHWQQSPSPRGSAQDWARDQGWGICSSCLHQFFQLQQWWSSHWLAATGSTEKATVLAEAECLHLSPSFALHLGMQHPQNPTCRLRHVCDGDWCITFTDRWQPFRKKQHKNPKYWKNNKKPAACCLQDRVALLEDF